MKINSTLKKIKDYSYAMTIEVDASEVDAEFNSVLQGIRRKVKLSGFRPGKAPLDIVEKNFIGKATEEVAQNLIHKAYAAGIREHGAKALTFPSVRDLSQVERGKKMKFVAEFDAAPEVKVKKYKGIKVVRGNERVPEDEIQKTLESIRDSRATIQSLDTPRPAVEGDVIQAEIEIVRDGKVVRAKEVTSFPVTKIEGREQVFESLVGVNIGDSKEIKFEEENLQYNITVQEIKMRVLPDIDEEFAKSLGKESLDLLKEEIRKDIAAHLRQQSREKMKGQIFDDLIQSTPFPLSPAVIDQQAKKLMQEKGLNQIKAESMSEDQKKSHEELLAKLREQAEKQVRLFFILDKVGEAENIQVSDDDVSKKIAEVAAYSQKDADEVAQSQGEDIRYHLKQQKIIDFLLAEASIQDESAETANK